MNFFKLYIGDYQRDTAHLSITEHGAYLLMLQHYYATEKPLPSGKALHRMLRAQDKAERDAIDSVAGQFWTTTPGGLVNSRADDELTKAGAQAETNRSIAQAREAKRKAAREWHEQSTNRATNDQPNHSQTPDTSNSPIAPKGASKVGAVGLKAWVETIKARGEKPIPPGDPVLSYADKVGLPRDFLVLAWQQFLHVYTTSRDGKRYRDWRKVFRSAVEANWMKLWYLDGQANTYALTTVGHQAQRAHEDRRAA